MIERLVASFMMGAILLDSRILGPWRRPDGRLRTELLGVLGVQSLPAAELHRLWAGDAAHGSSAQKMIQNIETNVPPGSTHCDKAVTDVGPEREPRAPHNGFELPAHLKVA